MQKFIINCIILIFCSIYGTSAYAQNTKTIKLAAINVLSGKFSEWGNRYQQGIKYAVEQINLQQGLAGCKIELIPVDNELNPEIAVQKTKELIENGVKHFIIGAGSHIGMALLPLAQEHKVLIFSYSIEADSLTGEKCSRYFFRTTANTTMHSNALAFWIVMNGYKNIFAIAQDYAFGRDAVSAFKKKIQELSPAVQVKGEIYHPIGQEDFTDTVKTIAESGAEIIFTSDYGQDIIMLIKEADLQGLKIPFAGYYLNDDLVIKETADNSVIVGSVGCENYTLAAPGEKNKEFIEKFHKEKGYYPTWQRSKAYMSVMFWAEAVKKAGTADVEAVIDAWEGLIYDGPAGKWYMRPCDHQMQMPMWIGKIEKDNPFFSHAFIKQASSIAERFITVPCENTGCPGLSKSLIK